MIASSKGRCILYIGLSHMAIYNSITVKIFSFEIHTSQEFCSGYVIEFFSLSKLQKMELYTFFVCTFVH